MDDIKRQISIPADTEGFILLQCPLCRELFKLKANEMHEDSILEIWCPICGLKGGNYFTEDVKELAIKMISNTAMELIHDEFKKIERNFKGGLVSVKIGSKPKREFENSIIDGVNALEVVNYKCCKVQAKIKPMIKMVGSYCPYCGVRHDYGNR